jgi:predicted AAA+ superfamily ATPase
LYYFEQNGKLEIDFFIRKNKTAAAVEVKSADNTKSKSLETVIAKYGIKHGIKLSAKNVGGTEHFYTLPLYMAMFL